MKLTRGEMTANWRFGIRARVTVLATLVVAITLALSGIILILLVDQSLVAGLDSAQSARAQSVVALVTASDVNGSIPTTAQQNSLVQVLDSTGSVIAATGNVQGEVAVLASPPSRRHSTALTLSNLPLDNGGAFRVFAEPVTLKTGLGWVYVASSLAQVDAAIASLSTTFAIGLPLVLIVVGLTVWRAVAQSLRPVDQIRRRASAIGAADLTQRVPVPPGHDEIARLAATMNSMLDRLETAATRQSQFVGDASHELKSPLAALRAQVDVALAHPDPAEAENVLGIVRAQIARMTMLIDDLLFLARSTETTPMVLAAPVDLDEIVLDEIHRLRELGGPTITLVSIGAARVLGSRRDLTRALRNLDDNAREHARSEVRLSLDTKNGFAELAIVDDGPGIAVQNRTRVFERFTRIDDSRSRSATGGGTGLGLSITRQIVVTHGGTIVIHNRSDGHEGAAFVIRIPLAG